MVSEGKFRKDLYYRLNVLSFHLLPLRSRPLDVEFLARKFAVDCSRSHGIPLQSITEEFIETLRHYHWPGNIRELENVVRRAVLYCNTGVLTPATLPASMKNTVQRMDSSTVAETDYDVSSVKQEMISVGTAEPQTMAQQTMEPRTLESQMTSVEKRVIQETLRRHNQHRTATARELGISRVTLYNKMRKFGMLS